MAKNSAVVNLDIVNEAQTTVVPGTALAYVLGPTLLGKLNDPSEIITSIAQFKRLYGGVSSINMFPTIAMRMLAAGVNLRVCRVPNTGAVVAEAAEVVNSEDDPLFTLKAIGPGSYYNGMLIDIDPGTGSAFTLTITKGTIVETYELEVSEWGESTPYSYMDEVINNSALVTVEYADISTLLVAPTLETLASSAFADGEDGTIPVVAGYTGSAGVGGVYSFDPFDDGVVIACPQEMPIEASMVTLDAALSAYVSDRKDMIAVLHIPNSKTTQAAIATYVDSVTLGTNKKFSAYYGGGLVTSVDGVTTNISEAGDMAAIIANQYNDAPWLSPAGYKRGVINNSLGVVSNFGSPAKYDDLELITNDGVNMVIRRNGQVMALNGYTMAADNTPEKFLSIIMLELYMQKILRPTLETFLAEPNDFETWNRLYWVVKPFLDGLVTNRALFDYEWEGDQFATSIDNLEINTADDVQNGIYKVQLQIKTISPIVVINLEIILTNAGVEFK